MVLVMTLCNAMLMIMLFSSKMSHMYGWCVTAGRTKWTRQSEKPEWYSHHPLPNTDLAIFPGKCGGRGFCVQTMHPSIFTSVCHQTQFPHGSVWPADISATARLQAHGCEPGVSAVKLGTYPMAAVDQLKKQAMLASESAFSAAMLVATQLLCPYLKALLIPN